MNYSSKLLESVTIRCNNALRANQFIIPAIRTRDSASCSKAEAGSPVACLLEPAHELVEEDHLAGGDHQAVHRLGTVPAVPEVRLSAAE